MRVVWMLPLWLMLLYLPLLLGYHSATPDQIQAIIEAHHQWHIGCAVYSMKDKMPLYEYNAQQLFIPASNTKLFTGALALELLGMGYQFATQLLFDGNNLYLKGAGDPSFTSANLEALIATIAKKGITMVGDFYCDDTVFDHDVFAPGALIDNIGYSWNGLVTGLLVDRLPLVVEPVTPTIFLTTEQNDKLSTLFCKGALLIEQLLNKYHIQLQGTVKSQKTDANATVVAAHYSEPLSTLLVSMMKSSDNLYADCFFKKVGAGHFGGQGTWQKGINALQEFLQQHLQLTAQDLVITDGSGRSRYNLIAPNHIIALLLWVTQQPYRQIFFASLPISGVDGTLAKRMTDIPGKVKAKTGCLSGVSTLSGCVELADDTLLFSIMNNAFISESLYNAPCRTLVEDAIGRLLSA